MKKLLAKYNNYRKNHKWFDILSEHTIGIIVCITSAFIIALAMQAFVAPNTETLHMPNMQGAADLPPLIAGGANGISQIITKIAGMIFVMSGNASDIVKWVSYAIINIPLIVIAFMKIGKKFAIYTLLNVLITIAFSLTISTYTNFFSYIAINFQGNFLPRALFGGMLIGVSGGIAFRFGQSTGGMDIIGHILASKKSALTGRFSLGINVAIMLVFVVLSVFKPDDTQIHAISLIQETIGNPPITPADYSSLETTAKLGFFIVIVFCSFAYLLTSSFVMDLINLRNKKEMLQIVTRNKDMAGILVHSFKHGVTTMAGRGEFTKEGKIIIIMTVSHYETASVIALVKENDPEAFVNVISLRQVYGRFYIPPIK